MDRIEIYTLVLCLVVLFGLSTLFIYFLWFNIKQRIKLINLGDEDEEIKIEYSKVKKSNAWDLISKIFSIVVTLLLCAVFVFSIYINFTEEKKANGVPSLKVVRTASMSYKNSKNEYLFDYELDNQLQVYDLIVTRHLPGEFDLKLYDIVVYKAENGDMIIHRIVGIEEPNEKHPDCRYFMLQGDAIMYPDTYPVLYSQMRGIYVGERMPFAGNFIMFMQSPAGYFCIALILIAIIVLPMLEDKVEKVKRQRYALICDKESQIEVAQTIDESDSLKPEISAIEKAHDPFKKFSNKRDERTFEEKLQSLEVTNARYEEIVSFINDMSGVRLIEGKKAKTYKIGNTPIVKLTIRGKTLNAYVALNPENYENTKYIYTDCSQVKAYKNYPMRVKATSDRQVKWIKELLGDVVKGADL